MPPELGLTARAVVKKVVDGDTIDIELRLPCRIRLLDCWAPEANTEEGAESKLQLEYLLPKGSNLIVQIPTTEAHNLKDVFTFGRVLGNVWVEGSEVSLSEFMVKMGFATREK